MDSKTKIFHDNFIKPVEKTGRNTILVACAFLFLPGLYLWLFHGLMPPSGALMRSLIGIWSFAIVFSIVEPIIYFPLIGLGGTYMSFLAGNLVNLRLPISITAQEVVGTTEGSPEAEIVSTLGVAGSLIGSQLVMFLGVFIFLPFIGRINTTGSSVSAALDQVLPALFGALGGIFLFKNIKLGIVPILLGFIIAFTNKNIPYSYVIPPLVIVSVLSARIMYKKKWVQAEDRK